MEIHNERSSNLDTLLPRTIKSLAANNLGTLLISSAHNVIKKPFVDAMVGRFPNLKQLTFLSSQILSEDSFKTIATKYTQITEFKYLWGTFSSYHTTSCVRLKNTIASNIADFMNSSANLNYAQVQYDLLKHITCKCKGAERKNCLTEFHLHLQNVCEKANPSFELGKALV